MTKRERLIVAVRKFNVDYAASHYVGQKRLDAIQALTERIKRFKTNEQNNKKGTAQRREEEEPVGTYEIPGFEKVRFDTENPYRSGAS